MHTIDMVANLRNAVYLLLFLFFFPVQGIMMSNNKQFISTLLFCQLHNNEKKSSSAFEEWQWFPVTENLVNL